MKTEQKSSGAEPTNDKRASSRIGPTHYVLVALFTLAFTIHELGVGGRLSGSFWYGSVFPPLRRVSAFFTDLKFKIRGRSEARHPITIVEVDSPSIDSMGRWPWRRDYIALLVDQIFALGAKTVGLDIIFSEAEKRVPEELEELLERKGLSAVAAMLETDPKLRLSFQTHADNLALAWTSESPCQPLYTDAEECPVSLPAAIASLPKGIEKFAVTHITAEAPFSPRDTPIPSVATMISNLDAFNQVALHSGFVNSSRDPDGLIRRSSLIMMVNGRPYPSLPLEMARMALKDELEISLDRHYRISQLAFQKSGRAIPVTPAGVMDVNFRGPERVFPYISAAEIFKTASCETAECRTLASAATDKIRGSIVLVGITAAALADITATPFEATFPGVEAHATILDNLLSGDMMIPAGAESDPALIFALTAALMLFGGSLFAFFVARLEALPALYLFVGTFVFFVLADLWLFFSLHRNWNTGFFHLEIVFISLLLISEKYVVEEQFKKRAEAKVLEQEKRLLVETVAKVRMETELKTAQLVQETLLRPPTIDNPSVDLASCYLPATECGGDFWDAALHGNQLRLLIGDATGHGAPAAIVTAVAKSCFETVLTLRQDPELTPDECLSIFNKIVSTTCRGKLLMSMCFVQIDLATGELLVANAGHVSPLCLRRNIPLGSEKGQRAETLFARGEPLGFDGVARYRMERFQLDPGDILLLYTDGISEAHDAEGAEWGERRLRRCFEKGGARELITIRNQIMAAVNEHTRGRPQDDDVTFVLVSWKGRAVLDGTGKFKLEVAEPRTRSTQ